MATIRLTVNTNGASLPNAYKQPKLEPVTSEDLKNPRYCSPCIHNVHNERVNSLLTYLHVLNFTGLGNNSGSDSGSNDTSRPIIRRIITGGSELYPDFIYINSTYVCSPPNSSTHGCAAQLFAQPPTHSALPSLLQFTQTSAQRVCCYHQHQCGGGSTTPVHCVRPVHSPRHQQNFS
uniref:Lysine-specific demethylase 6B n=1 Tax=Lygus hesperus TaxID=30085 RepID=A0A0A9Z826_LYGHE